MTEQENESISTEMESKEDQVIDIEVEDVSKLSDEDLAKFTESAKNDLKDSSVPESKSAPVTLESIKNKPKDQLSDKERILSLEKQIENLEKIKNDRGGFIEKQNSVIIGLKEKVDSLSKKKEELDRKSSNESFWEDPKAAMAAEKEKSSVDEDLKTANTELLYRINRSEIERTIPDYEKLVDDIIDYIKDVDPERTTEEVIANYKKDPFAIDPKMAIQFANSARLFKKNRLLEEKVEAVISSPKRVLSKVNNAANYKTATSSNGDTRDSDMSNVSSADFSKMSDKELSDYIASAKKSTKVN